MNKENSTTTVPLISTRKTRNAPINKKATLARSFAGASRLSLLQSFDRRITVYENDDDDSSEHMRAARRDLWRRARGKSKSAKRAASELLKRQMGEQWRLSPSYCRRQPAHPRLRTQLHHHVAHIETKRRRAVKTPPHTDEKPKRSCTPTNHDRDTRRVDLLSNRTRCGNTEHAARGVPPDHHDHRGQDDHRPFRAADYRPDSTS